MKFALFASGSKGNSFLLQDESLAVLVDCGTTKKYLTGCFQEIGFDPAALDAVLITHAHTDHVSQIRMFKDLPVYSPVALPVDRIPVEFDQPFQLQHLTVRPLALSHDAERTTGYIFESWQEKLVYITDTGYLKDSYLPLIKGADYIVLESNHDVEMLMHTARPMYLKSRIASDEGHLCNEDCAAILDEAVTEKTKVIILAHISQEANTRQKALQVSAEQIFRYHRGRLNPSLVIAAAGQYEMIQGGAGYEKTALGTCYCTAGMEQLADL